MTKEHPCPLAPWSHDSSTKRQSFLRPSVCRRTASLAPEKSGRRMKAVILLGPLKCNSLIKSISFSQHLVNLKHSIPFPLADTCRLTCQTNLLHVNMFKMLAPHHPICPRLNLAVVRDDRPLHLHVKVSELDIRIRLLERTPTMTCPCLVHCNDFLSCELSNQPREMFCVFHFEILKSFSTIEHMIAAHSGPGWLGEPRPAPAHLVGDDLPHRVHHSVVVHIQRQGQWRGDDGPGAEVGTRFEEGQTWWLSQSW